MATDFQTLYGDAQKFLKDSSSVGLVMIKKFINRAYRDAWVRFPWPERHAQAFLAMTAPYTTGTVTVTNGLTTVTGSGTTFPSYGAGTVKFALSINGEWYGVATRDSATQLTLDRNYLGDTAAGVTYIVYRDIYTLASDVGSLLSLQLGAHKAGWGASQPVDRATAEGEWGFPTTLGTPTKYVLHDRASGVFRVRLGPEVPDDDNFAIRYSYLKDITELSGTADEPLFHEDRRDLILYGALSQAYAMHGRISESQGAAVTFERLLAQAWASDKSSQPVVMGLRGIGRAGGSGYPAISYPVVAP